MPSKEWYASVEAVEKHIQEENSDALRLPLLAMIRTAKKHNADWRLYGSAVCYLAGWFGLDPTPCDDFSKKEEVR